MTTPANPPAPPQTLHDLGQRVAARGALVIATRGSALARWQADHVAAALARHAPGLRIEQRIIKTTGDAILDVPLSEVGGKALFVKEIEQALLDGDADLAVHSMKDVPAELAPGLALAATSTRESPWDALCTRDGVGLAGLPAGATVGTSSLRRQCQLLARRADLRVVMLRGNVPTRLGRLDDGSLDAVVLAHAGLVRLGLADRVTEVLPAEVCLPAVAQGVLGLETRADDPGVIALVRAAMHDAAEAARVAAERAFLARMGGSCHTPLAALARSEPGALVLAALCGTPDGTTVLREESRGDAAAPEAVGHAAADALLARGAGEIVAACLSKRVSKS